MDSRAEPLIRRRLVISLASERPLHSRQAYGRRSTGISAPDDRRHCGTLPSNTELEPTDVGTRTILEPWDIRKMTIADVEDVVQVHIAAFPGFFLTRLGPRV